MKYLYPNQLFDGQSGKIGKYVVRNIYGEPHVSMAPRKHSKNHQYTEAQLEHRERFRRASQWAKAHYKDPEFVEAAKKVRKIGITSYTLSLQAAINGAMDILQE